MTRRGVDARSRATTRAAVAALAAVAACAPSSSSSSSPSAGGDAIAQGPRWVIAPPPVVVSFGAPRGRFGRGDIAERVEPRGVLGAARGGAGLAALADAQLWQVPDPIAAKPGRAIVRGRDRALGDALELVDVDAAAVRWRVADAGRVVVVTEASVVVADTAGTHALDVDTGARRWAIAQPPIAVTAGTIVVAGGGSAAGVAVIDAASGAAFAQIPLPRGVAATDAIAACPGGDVYARVAAPAAAALVRIVGGKATWRVSEAALGGRIAGIDACDDAVLVAVAAAAPALVAVARETGAITGRVDGVRGWWRSIDAFMSSIDIATAAGVWERKRRLDDPGELLPKLPPLGALLAERGERRLVRATPRTAVLIDRVGVRAVLPLAEATAALGAAAVAAAGGTGGAMRVFAMSNTARRGTRVPALHPGVARTAELRDLPPIEVLDDGDAIVAPGADLAGSATDAAVALDADDPASLYARAGGELGRASVATRTWAWRRDTNCRGALAAARGVVACLAGDGVAGFAAGDGTPRWTAAVAATALVAAGDVVVAFAGDRATFLGATDGRVLGALASDDGGAVVAAPLAPRGRAPTTLVVAVERGRLVALVPAAAMVPVWSLAIDGVARAVTAAGDGVIVELEGGDAYRVDVDGAVVALPALGVAWHPGDDVLAASCAGGPVPPNPMPSPPPPPPPSRSPSQLPAGTSAQAPSSFETLPPMSVPWPAPPAMAASWQLQLYELAGGLRAVDDYALAAPVAVAPRRADASIVIASSPHLVLVVDPRTGDPQRRIVLPDGPAAAFATATAGAPVAGVVLAAPLRVVTF